MFTEADQQTLLSAIGACRDACIEAQRKLPPYGSNPIYAAVGSLTNEIDRLAGVLTGDPTFFHLPWHSIHSGPDARQEKPDS